MHIEVTILQPYACTQRFRLWILRRTRSNAGRTSARSLSGRIESIWKTPSKERATTNHNHQTQQPQTTKAEGVAAFGQKVGVVCQCLVLSTPGLSPCCVCYMCYVGLTRQAAEPPLSPSSLLCTLLYVIYYSVRAKICSICAI